MSYQVRGTIRKLIIVGAGGTGALVLRGICRLLIDYHTPIIVVDPDRVESRNVSRQDFYQEDIGKFKAQALAERYSRLFRRPIGYIVQPFDKDLVEEGNESLETPLAITSLIIGCVDKADARRSIANALPHNWWMDAGNGFHSGQVLLGNTGSIEGLSRGFRERDMTVHKLPAPSLQAPALLLSPTKDESPSCAQAIANNDQSPVINHAMATLVLDMFYRLKEGTLDYMGTYLDLRNGTMRRVPASPNMVSRMFSIEESELMVNEEIKKKEVTRGSNRVRG